LAVFYVINITYRLLPAEQQRKFADIAITLDQTIKQIPLTFLLGYASHLKQIEKAHKSGVTMTKTGAISRRIFSPVEGPKLRMSNFPQRNPHVPRLPCRPQKAD